jgi:hypothetical protein
MESQSQEMLAKFGAAIIAALASIEKSSSEKGSSQINRSKDVGSQLDDEMQEDPHSFNQPIASTTEEENQQQIAVFAPQVVILSQTTFMATDLFRGDAASMIRVQYPLWRKGRFWKDNLNLPNRQGTLQRLLRASRRLDMLDKSERIGSIHLEMSYLFYFICYTKFMNCHIKTDCSATETLLKHLYRGDWDDINTQVQQKRRKHLQHRVSTGKKWFITVQKLSYGVIILCGRRLSTIM